uniref:Protein LTV1 homolog n=1 Tax=Evadne anonyx TaxID=141404 RepID=A0A9N6WTN4_9CRUS|nr:EOG090X08PQ [Evadne anonyx]
MPKTKKFIDKKNADTFVLVHRSQRDPLAADETAPQRVFVPVGSRGDRNDTTQSVQKPVDKVKRKEAQVEYGVYYDDDYDYLQHLRDVNQTAEWELAEDNKNSRAVQLGLPSIVFPSKYEEEVGLLNRAAPHSGPRPDLDPDIVAALDDDFDYDDPENQLEDDFITMANAGGLSDEEEDDVLGDLRSNSAEFSDPDVDDFCDKESRFTEYSMSSSVMRRNTGLTLVDDRFEQMYAEYDDEQMGALDCEEIEGHIEPNDEYLLKLATEFEHEKSEGLRLNQEIGRKVRSDIEATGSKYFEETKSDDDCESSSSEEEGVPERKWDCESILSTYSNLYNHPKLISEPSKKIQVDPKTGIPRDVLGKPGLTKKFLDQFNEATGDQDDDTQSMISTLSTISIRPKDETPAQRKERKMLVKDYRRERRMEKKANSLAFKEEKLRQEKQNLNNRVNVSGGLKLC